MNLVQIQNRLRDMPTQVVMAYANGKNPMVPAFLALGELNRRKQVEQSNKTQEAPEQSVKEKIENDVRLMQTMAGRQQEAMQKQAQTLAQQSTSAPASTPATNAEAFADGGIARLRSNFNLKGGGIIAFASPTEENNNSLVTDEEERKRKEREEFRRQLLSLPTGRSDSAYADRSKSAIKPESAPPKYSAPGVINKGYEEYLKKEASRDRGPDPFSEPDLPMPVSTPKPAPRPEAKPKEAPTGERPTAPRGPAPSAPSQTPDPGSGLANKYLSQFLEKLTDQQQYLPKSEMELLEEAKKTNPELAEKAGTRYERLMDQIAARDREDRERFKQQEKERQERRLIDVISGAGAGMARMSAKDQAGGRGILNLLGGIGQQAGAMREADIDRLNKQRSMEREQDILQAKIYSEIDNARRAEARGDVKSLAEHEKNIATLKSEFQKNQTTQLGKAAELTETARKNLIDEELKRLQLQQQAAQTAKTGLSGIEQVYNFVDKKFPNLTSAQKLEMAKSLTNAGIGAEGRLDAEALRKVADVEKRYGMLIAGSKDPATKQKFIDQRDAEIQSITGKVQGGGGGVSTAGFGEPQRVK